MDYDLPDVEALCYIARDRAERNDPAAKQAINEAIAVAKKSPRNDHRDAQHYAYILWAVAPSNDMARMSEICEAASNDPRLRCEVYTNTVAFLINLDSH